METFLPSRRERPWEADCKRKSTAHCHQPVNEASYIEIWPAELKTFQVWIWMGMVALIAAKENWKLHEEGRQCLLL